MLPILEEKSPLLAFQLRSAEKKEIPFASYSLPKEETEALYLREVGTPSWQEKLLKWLEGKKERRIYLIPKEVHSLYLLEVSLLNHPRFFLGSQIGQFIWEHLYKPWELFGEGEEELSEAILGVELTLSLYSDFGLKHLTNVFANLSKKNIKNGEDLKGEFQGIPAVICGAGPSLERSFKILKQMGDRALIFGGGSSLAPLSKNEIPLHFAACIDPDPPRIRFSSQTYFETPLLYQNSVSSDLLSHHHGPKLCFGESGCYDLEKYLMGGTSLSPIDVGWNVSTFCAQLATLLGCNPIIFVGLDLCVYEKSSYAKGVEGEDTRKNPLKLLDRFGKEVTTRPDFLMAKKWLEEFARNSPETIFINASEGGLELEGIPYKKLEIPKRSFDLHAKVLEQVMEATPLKFAEKNLQVLDQSLKKTLKILESFLSPLEKGENLHLLEFELGEELFFQKHLEPLWRVWKELIPPQAERKLQEILFYKTVTEKFCNARNLPI